MTGVPVTQLLESFGQFLVHLPRREPATISESTCVLRGSEACRIAVRLQS